MRKFMFYNRFFIINSHPIGMDAAANRSLLRSLGKFGMAQGYKQHAPTELRTH